MERKRESAAVGEGGFESVLHPTDKDPSAGTPVLGLFEAPAALPVQWGTVPSTIFAQPEPDKLLELTVIVPARNEEDCLAACLESLVSQSEELFKLGCEWELIVVDDHSNDRTAAIARGFAGVTVLEAGMLKEGWTGKNNAIWAAAKRARGQWLLFTDADTVHQPGNLHRALR